MLKKITLLCMRHRDKRFLRAILAAFFALFRSLFSILPLKLSFFLIVLVRRLDARTASFLASDFRELAVKKAAVPRDFHFSSILTAQLPLQAIAILVRLGAFQEAKTLLSKHQLKLSKDENLLWVVSDYFDCGELERAQELIDLCSAAIQNSPELAYLKGLMLLLNDNEESASLYLMSAANLLPAGWCPHQNIAARYPAIYDPLLSDQNTGTKGLLFDAYHFLGQRVVAVGRGELSASLHGRAMEMQKQLMKVPPVISAELKLWLEQENTKFEDLRILPWEWVTQIGHLGMLEILLRMRTLGWWSGQALILAPPGKVANNALLTLFERQAKILVAGVNVSESLSKELFSLQRYLGLNFNAWQFPDGEVVPWQQAGARLMRQWELEQRAHPLLEAFDLHYENSDLLTQAADIKRQWGMQPDDWYVCLHVRDAEFYSEFKGFGQTHRNADLESYEAAIRYISDQGGWVIKMGGANSSDLPKFPRVVNYARSPFKSDFLDLHLIRHARFFIGTTSGLTNIAMSFNVPCALVNCITTDAQLWNSRVRFAFKPIVTSTGGALSQRQITSTPWRWRVFNVEALRRYDAEVKNNSADEILETVKEVKSLADGNLRFYQESFLEVHGLLARWKASLSLPEFYGAALPSLYYLDKYEKTFLEKQKVIN